MESTFRRARRFRLPVPLVVAAVVVLAAGLYLRSGPAKPAMAPAAAAPLELAPADVAEVRLGELSRSLPLTGSLTPLVQTTVKAKVAGEVLEVSVREGQAVKRGDVLVRLDTRYSKPQVDNQQAALEKARADLALAKLNRDNAAEMLKEHFISQNAYDSAASTYAADLATAKAAEAQLRLVQVALEDTVVRAPIDGSVAKRLVDPGEKINIDSNLLVLVDLAQMEWQAPAPASEIPSIKVGQTAHFSVGGFDGRRFDARVQRINPVTEAGSRAILVYLAVPNQDGALHGGMFAEGALVLDQTAPTPSMPAAAVHADAGVDYVYVLADGHIQHRRVDLGLRSEDQGSVEVRGGLKPGEQVIVGPIDALKDGAAAMVKTPAAPAGS